jgi:hypothetical protein
MNLAVSSNQSTNNPALTNRLSSITSTKEEAKFLSKKSPLALSSPPSSLSSSNVHPYSKPIVLQNSTAASPTLSLASHMRGVEGAGAKVLVTSSRHQSLSNSSKIVRLPQLAATTTAHSSPSSNMTQERMLLFDDPRYRAKQLKKQRKQDIQKRFNDFNLHDTKKHHHHHHHHLLQPKIKSKANESNSENKVAKCHLTFIFDPNGRLSYWMSKIVPFLLFFIIISS